MGGTGSGRHYRFGGETTADYRQIDVRRWQREGLLLPELSFRWRWLAKGEAAAAINVVTEPGKVVLCYRTKRNGEAWKDREVPVRLTTTPCKFGGERYWFECPALGCGRRVAILYLGTIPACRHCFRLAYPSQRETEYDRAGRRADRIRERLGWEPGFLNGIGDKPKGMHWRTYERLVHDHNRNVNQSVGGFLERFRGNGI